MSWRTKAELVVCFREALARGATSAVADADCGVGPPYGGTPSPATGWDGVMTTQPQRTPDGRYIVVNGRLWRASNPHLSAADRERYTRNLMAARRAVRTARLAEDASALRVARDGVQAAKVALGERGPAWWDDGAPDFNRRLLRNTPYAAAMPDS